VGDIGDYWWEHREHSRGRKKGGPEDELRLDKPYLCQCGKRFKFYESFVDHSAGRSNHKLKEGDIPLRDEDFTY